MVFIYIRYTHTCSLDMVILIYHPNRVMKVHCIYLFIYLFIYHSFTLYSVIFHYYTEGQCGVRNLARAPTMVSTGFKPQTLPCHQCDWSHTFTDFHRGSLLDSFSLRLSLPTLQEELPNPTEYLPPLAVWGNSPWNIWIKHESWLHTIRKHWLSSCTKWFKPGCFVTIGFGSTY